ncbi:MAG: CopD family protein [Alphaproteobacteria bacterium]|nr:CopD family protein [Alphaproteobacteria bacterium]
MTLEKGEKTMWYLALKAGHIMAIISWMAGLFYLPRLFVYHAMATPNGEAWETFKGMERRLLNQITTPAMIASWVLGGAIVLLPAGWAPDETGGELIGQYWYLAKLALVIGLTLYHVMLIHYVRVFARDENVHSHVYYRFINEVPTVVMIGVIVLVVFHPF